MHEKSNAYHEAIIFSIYKYDNKFKLVLWFYSRTRNLVLSIPRRHTFTCFQDITNTIFYVHDVQYLPHRQKPQVVDMLNWPAVLQLTIFSGILCPLRYLTFSCSVFIISVSFLPSTNSSYTYICTCSWKEFGCSLTVTPIMRAITEPLE